MKNDSLPITPKKAQVLHQNNIDFGVVAKFCLDKILSLTPNIRIKKFELCDSEEASKGMLRPSILFFGEVVHLFSN